MSGELVRYNYDFANYKSSKELVDMIESKRSYYIDNLKWMIILLLIPYHTAQAWNVWSEPNYIFFDGNKLISSIIVFFSPYIMPLMFVLAGINTRYSLKKRSYREYIGERVKRLLIPLAFGTIVFMPIMTYIADCFNYSYKGSFINHYSVFFTKYTDLVGADGGFSFGQFWFLLYLFVISLVVVLVISLLGKDNKKTVSLWLVLVMGLPLPFFSKLLSIGGKSLVEYTYLFIVGYYVFADENILSKLVRFRWWLIIIGVFADCINVYLFIWSGNEFPVLNTATKFITEWIMILALLGLSKKIFNQAGKICKYLSSRSFLIFSFHFIWVVVFQYMLYQIFGNKTVILFIGSIALSYFAAFICSEIAIRIPLLCLLMGVKRKTKSN